MTSSLISIIQLLFGVATFVFALRFLLHFSRADYYNPITQGVVKATNPLVLPLQKLLPAQGRIDLASLLLGVAMKALALVVIMVLAGELANLPILNMLIVALGGMAKTLLDIYFFALIIMIILSWVAPQANHPGAALVYQLTEPIMQPVRRLIPSLGGLDLSPIVVFLAINLLSSLISGAVISSAGLLLARLGGL